MKKNRDLTQHHNIPQGHWWLARRIEFMLLGNLIGWIFLVIIFDVDETHHIHHIRMDPYSLVCSFSRKPLLVSMLAYQQNPNQSCFRSRSFCSVLWIRHAFGIGEKNGEEKTWMNGEVIFRCRISSMNKLSDSNSFWLGLAWMIEKIM